MGCNCNKRKYTIKSTDDVEKTENLRTKVKKIWTFSSDGKVTVKKTKTN